MLESTASCYCKQQKALGLESEASAYLHKCVVMKHEDL